MKKTKKMGIGTVRRELGYSIEEAATYANITPDELTGYEADHSTTPILVAVKLLEFYDVPFEKIAFRN
ncbi:helix-turn-helix domain-containing protein [Paenibacillus polymyxa]|uniref:helix-turn-helix domain-containing protein n=1 Tax=Paenibacillus polymyxa TaxID=1406 RepID=UPI0008ACADE2|nr:helix-turn-helix transcriptional regulator [Paenibacillus polymyxa]SEI73944.1 Helix-turn-helix [Paenibacillus polymyxa]